MGAPLPSWTELLPFVALGLLGSLHCAGMCGGFALAVSLAAGPGRRRALTAALLYLLGKALTYAVLGALAARAVLAAAHGGARLLGGEREHAELALALQRGAAWISGALFVLFALFAFGLAPRGFASGMTGGPVDAVRGRARAALAFLAEQVRSLPGRGRGFYTGLVNGLLPCGLTWSALALAAGGGPVRGALGLFLFGLATAPALVAVGLSGRALGAAHRRRWLRLAAPLALAFGVLTILRAAPRADGEPGPACCTQGPAAPLAP